MCRSAATKPTAAEPSAAKALATAAAATSPCARCICKRPMLLHGCACWTMHNHPVRALAHLCSRKLLLQRFQSTRCS